MMEGELRHKKSDFQALAHARLNEAKVLLAAGAYDGAYYLSGYVAEFALKAIISGLFEFPPRKAEQFYVHDLDKLRVLAELKTKMESSKNSALLANWSVVADWSEESRYQR